MKIKLLYIAAILLIISCNRKNDYADLEEQVLHEYLYEFVERAAIHGVDISYVYDHKIELHFADLCCNKAGRSYAYNNDKKIKIFIDKTLWDNSSYNYRKTLMYHELGHDILRYEHGDGPIIMETSARRGNKRAKLYKTMSIEEAYEYTYNELFTHYANN